MTRTGELAGKVLFIAGAGPQMSAATARIAAREGAKVALAQLTIPSMLERGGGSFLFNSSAASLVAGQVRFGYQVAKAGINALTRFIASKYGRQGIRANATLPFVVGGEVGRVATAAQRQTMTQSGRQPPEAAEQ